MSRSSPRSSIRTLTAASDDANRSRFSASSLPDNPAPMMAIRLIASSFSPRFVVLLVVLLRTQAVPRRRCCQSVNSRSTPIAPREYTLDFVSHWRNASKVSAEIGEGMVTDWSRIAPRRLQAKSAACLGNHFSRSVTLSTAKCNFLIWRKRTWPVVEARKIFATAKTYAKAAMKRHRVPRRPNPLMHI
jgi:hypothetical protein